MKYWIGIYVGSNTPGLPNAVENVVLSKGDGRLWYTDEYVSNRGVDNDGNEYFTCSLFFMTESDRTAFHGTLQAINGMLNSAMPGSYIKMTKCWHDEKVNNLCPRLDEMTYEEVI